MAITIKKANDKLTIDVTDKNNHGLNDLFSINKDGEDVDNGAIMLSIRSIHYKKELYKPGHAQIELVLSKEPTMDIASVMDAIKKYFMPSSMLKLDVKLEVTETDSKGTKTKVSKYPVKDYYICDMNVENRMLEYLNGSVKATQYKKVITIHAYSPDYFLTLAKYNRTYLGKTLSTIIREKIGGIAGLGSFPADTDLRLCHTTSTTDNIELKQPYLVQFNESFYDFVVRVAHRCGELFYYDNGKLILGIDKDNLETKNNDEDFKSTKLNLNPANFSYSNLPEGAKVATEPFPLSLIEHNGKDYGSVGDAKMYTSAMTTNDDYLNTVDRKKDSISQVDLWEPHWFELAHDAFQATSGDAALFTAIKDAANILMQGAATASNGDVEISETTETDANALFSKSGSGKYANLYNTFYDWIEKQEKESSDSVQENLYNNTPPASKLGECVRFSDDTATVNAPRYLVCGVECSITPFFRERGIEEDEMGALVQTYNQVTDVKGKVTVFELHDSSLRTHKKAYQKKVFPPLYDIPHIRKAKPQQAIVSNIADPLRMGRVQIRYPWSHEAVDEKKKTTTNASPWIAMTTPFTGNDHGGFLMSPNPGDYVMVDYEDGNIERPFVNGSLYKEKAKAPWGSTIISPVANQYGKPHRSITSGGNGITFVDGQAKNFLANLLPGVFGMIVKLAGDKDKNLKDSKLGGGLVLSDWYGLYNISMNSATRSINIDSPWGSVNMSAFTGIKINCPNGDIDIVGKNVNISAGNNLTLKSGTNIKKPGSDQGLDIACSSLTALGGFIMGGVTALTSLNSTTTAIFSSVKNLADCSFIRNIWEIIFRPVDGSLTVNSMRNVILQSGMGNVNVPSDTLSDEGHANADVKIKLKPLDISGSKGWSSAKEDAIAAQNSMASGAFFYIARTYIDVCRNYLDEVATFVSKAINFTVWPDIDANRLKDNVDLTQKLFDEEDLSIEILKEVEVPEANAAFESNDALFNRIKAEYDRRKQILEQFKRIADLTSTAKTRTSGSITNAGIKEKIRAALGVQVPTGINIGYTIAVEEYSLLDGQKLSLDKIRSFNKDDILKEWSKQIVLKLAEIANANNKLGRVDENRDINLTSISNIRATALFNDAPGKSETKSKLLNSFISGMGLSDFASYDSSSKEWKNLNGLTKLFNINGKAGTRSLWEVGGQGSILLSANSAETLELGKDSKGWKANPNIMHITMGQVLDKLGVRD